MLIRIFPHTTDEFEDEIALKYWLNHTLPYDQEGCYHLRTTQGVGQLPPGSLVLFRFKKNIVGSALVKQGVQPLNETIGGITYKGLITFDPDSIYVYDYSIPIAFLEDLTQRDFSFARTYFKIKLSEA